MLLRPSLMDDEMDRGYLGRVKRLNGFRDKRETTDALRLWHAGRSTAAGKIGTTELLSHCAGVSLEVFTAAHMTLPWRRAVTPFHPEVAHGSASAASIHRISGFRLARDGAYLCPECILDDQTCVGFCYWRRAHQIPGRYLCPRHSTPLRRVEDEWCFLDTPSARLGSSTPIDYGLLLDSNLHPLTQRFAAIGDALMARAAPLALRSVMRALKRRAHDCHLQVDGGEARRPLLSDLILDSYPTAWLQEVFPPAKAKRRGACLHQLDGVLYLSNAASSVEAYLLAAAVLFASSDDAVAAFLSEDENHEPSAKRQLKPTPTQKALHDAYVAVGGRYSAVAALCGTSVAIARGRLERMGLPNLVRGRAQRDFMRAAIAFYEEGRTLVEAARIGGVPTEEFEALVREGGVSLAGALSSMVSGVALQAA